MAINSVARSNGSANINDFHDVQLLCSNPDCKHPSIETPGVLHCAEEFDVVCPCGIRTRYVINLNQTVTSFPVAVGVPPVGPTPARARWLKLESDLARSP